MTRLNKKLKVWVNDKKRAIKEDPWNAEQSDKKLKMV